MESPGDTYVGRGTMISLSGAGVHDWSFGPNGVTESQGRDGIMVGCHEPAPRVDHGMTRDCW